MNKNQIQTKADTKVAIIILSITAFVIFGGIMIFKSNQLTPEEIQKKIAENVETGLILDQTKISHIDNPKIMGKNKVSSSTDKIYVTEFLDYLCPACAVGGKAITSELLNKYGDNIIITNRIFPVHGQDSYDIGVMVLATQILGNDFYEKFHNQVLEKQNDWMILGKSERKIYFKKMIEEMGGDFTKVEEAMKEDKYRELIAKDDADAKALKIRATPSFIIGTSTRVTGTVPFDVLHKIIK